MEGAAPEQRAPEAAEASFDTLGLDTRIRRALTRMRWARPTPVQRECIKLALEGKDVLARAPTGSGKTAGYALPALHKLLKQRTGLPLVSTFHTLARVKAETGDPEPEERARAEAEVMACSDAVLANCVPEAEQLEHHYQADPDRIEIVPPGVDHAYFSPGNQAGARWALEVDDRPLLLFVGRIQPLKGVDVAVRTLAALERDARDPLSALS